MSNSSVLYGVIFAIAALWSGLTGAVAWGDRVIHGRGFLGAMMMVAAFWGVAELLGSVAPLFFPVSWLMVVRYISMAILPAAWYAWISSSLSNDDSPASVTVTRLTLLPLMTTILAATHTFHGLLWRLASDGSIVVLGGWVWVQLAYSCALLLVGGIKLAHRALQAQDPWRGRWGILMGAGVVVALNSTLRFFWLEGWVSPIMHLLLAGYGVLLLGCLHANNGSPISLWAQRVFRAYPHEAVLALDARDRVLDANECALLLLAEHGVWWAVGRRATDVLAGPLAPLADADADETVTLDVVGGARHAIQPRVLPLGPAFGPRRARALVLHRVA